MDRLADRVIAAEREAHVRHSARRPTAGQLALESLDRLDERDRVVVVLLHAGRNGEDVRVEDDVLRPEPDHLRQQAVGTLEDRDAPLDGVCLALLVERHHDDRGAVAAGQAGLPQELVLALLQRQRIHDPAALELLQTGFDDRPLGAVDHDGDDRDVRLRPDPAQELGHRRDAVEHRLVHVHVDELRAVRDLLACDVDGLVLAVLRDEPGEFARAGDIGPLTDVDEGVAGRRDHDRLEAGQAGDCLRFGNGAGLVARDRGRDGRDVRRGRPAAAAGDVEQAVLGPLAQRSGHLLGRLVIAAQVVRQTRVRVRRHGNVGDPRQDVKVLAQLLRAERAVEADDQWLRVTDAVPERLDGLPREGPSGGIDDRPADDQGNPLAQLVEQRFDGENRRLRVQRIEDCLDEQQVGPALDETSSGVAVRGLQLLPGHGACRGVADIRADGGSPVRRPEGSGHVSRAARIRAFRRVGCLAREARRGHVHLADDIRAEPVVGLGDGRRRE